MERDFYKLNTSYIKRFRFVHIKFHLIDCRFAVVTASVEGLTIFWTVCIFEIDL